MLLCLEIVINYLNVQSLYFHNSQCLPFRISYLSNSFACAPKHDVIVAKSTVDRKAMFITG